MTKPTKTEASGDNEEIRENSSHGDDVEKQSRPKQTGQGKKATKASDQQADEDDMKELQQALLSLTLVIHGKLNYSPHNKTSVPVIRDEYIVSRRNCSFAPRECFPGCSRGQAQGYRRRQLSGDDACVSEDRQALLPDCYQPQPLHHP